MRADFFLAGSSPYPLHWGFLPALPTLSHLCRKEADAATGYFFSHRSWSSSSFSSKQLGYPSARCQSIYFHSAQAVPHLLPSSQGARSCSLCGRDVVTGSWDRGLTWASWEILGVRGRSYSGSAIIRPGKLVSAGSFDLWAAAAAAASVIRGQLIAKQLGTDIPKTATDKNEPQLGIHQPSAAVAPPESAERCAASF